MMYMGPFGTGTLNLWYLLVFDVDFFQGTSISTVQMPRPVRACSIGTCTILHTNDTTTMHMHILQTDDA